PNDEVRNDFKSALSVIENRCDSLLEFTDKYRKLVRITTPQKDYFSLASLFEKLERLNAKQLEGVDYRREGDFEDFVLFGDEKQLMHVFENLLFNSLQAFDRNKVRYPKLRVELSEMKSEFLILFKDNGGGIPEEALPYIFLPFYTTQEEGSGIGLSVARQILAKHKGQINWVREKAPFTTFSIRIPKGRG
ncbi:HAMP domain-containing sensor histidine kinase, partial [Lishizhenia sp.]|uniref:sensor histidine kinase n=1 Tax=Lishizhenia sp. TaxID=2497594 RepID=UPI00299CF2DE